MTRAGLAVGLTILVGCSASAEPQPQAAPVADGANSAVPSSRGGQELVGRPAPGWGALTWLHGEPVTLDQLRGEVVLIRFWTDTCPFCAATAPALADIYTEYGERGLAVLGFYHPKPRGKQVPIEAIQTRARELGIEFPVAVDTDWATLDAWWLATHERSATSVSFVLDHRGTIRFVHPGPEFSPDSERALFREDHAQVRAAIEALLAEREAAAS